MLSQPCAILVQCLVFSTTRRVPDHTQPQLMRTNFLPAEAFPEGLVMTSDGVRSVEEDARSSRRDVTPRVK